MPGRRPNPDRRIANLVSELKAALVAREQQRIEATVGAKITALLRGLKGIAAGDSDPSPVAAPRAASGPASASLGRGNRRQRSAASRRAQSLKMKAFWAAKRKGKTSAKPAVKPARAAPHGKAKPKAGKKKPSPGRLRQIAAMKEFWAKRKAAKANAKSAPAQEAAKA